MSRSIVDLAVTIKLHTIAIHSYLESQGLPSPTFHPNTPPVLLLSPELSAIRDVTLEALEELRLHLIGPVVHVASHEHAILSLASVQRFNIPHAIPVDGTATFAEIAQRCSLSEDDTRRILRHAMSHYYFAEPSKGIVEHTAASKAMVSFPLASQMLGFSCGELWPGGMRIADAIEKWPGSEEPNECGWALANNTDKKAYDIIDTTPMRAKRMADGMTFLHSGPTFNHEHLLKSYDWKSLSQGLLVDVGGSYGVVAIEIARHVRDITCIVQDLSEVVSKAVVPADLTTRLSFMEHDFFTEQPVKGADIYMLRWILHNWSDKYAVMILRNLIAAFKPGSRVLVSEICLPEYNSSVCPYSNRIPRAFDLFMKQLQNSKERDHDDWRLLFERADPRFKFLGVTSPPAFGLSIIEAVWNG
ncbi:hypothetical protein MMC17_005988 [Xylographa soralifera]|nr:hypothetical protein [Xylographa soralifera]